MGKVTRPSPEEQSRIEKIALLVGKQHNKTSIPDQIINAVIERESNFDVMAEGGIGEFGLMQVTQTVIDLFEEETGRSVANPNDAVMNINVGAWYLLDKIPRYLDYYGHTVNVENVIKAYNAGIGNLNKGNIPQLTLDYVIEIKKYLLKKSYPVIMAGVGLSFVTVLFAFFKD